MSKPIAFADFEVDATTGELRRGGVPVSIQDLPFRLLVALLERPGELVSRAELTTRLWGTETFVDAAAGLNTAVAKLREALGDDADAPRFIETVPKRGYRFVGAIADPAASGDAPSTASTRTWMVAAVVVLAALLGFATYHLRAGARQIRVAVMLFDNETGNAANDRLSQGLTDAAVTALAADSRLAVIGNAAVLRTARPFRDIAKVRDALDADFIVIGQVQTLDGATIVRAHLIRARDQAHVWANVIRPAAAGENALQTDVATQLRGAVDAHAFAR